jgi:hypothetical protein
MATKDEMSFEDAFNEDAPGKQIQSDDDAFGLNLGTEASAAPTGGESTEAVAPASDAAASAGGATENGSTDAAAVNDAFNAKASVDAKGETTGTQEAATGAAEGSPAEEATETPAQETAEVPDAALDASQASAAEGNDGGVSPDPYDLSDVPPEDLQKAKSWVGRLKKMEADLKARASTPAEKTAADDSAQAANQLEDVAIQADATNPALADAADGAAAQVAAGEITREEAVRMLTEDFGEDFVKLARIAFGSDAGEKVSELEQRTQSIIDHLQEGAEKQHYEAIFSAHPDFAEVAQSDAFKAYVDQVGKQDVVENGSASEINALLSDFKNSQGQGTGDATASTDAAPAAVEETPGETAAPVTAQADTVDEGDLDAAEGVRGPVGGLALPEEPRAGKDDFEKAWAEF